MKVFGDPANTPSQVRSWRTTSPNRAVRSTGWPARASDVAVGTGSSSSVWSTLIPIPITTIGGREPTRSTRIPQTLRSPIITSLGHFRVANPPSAWATAYPATSGTTGHHSVSTTGSKTAENVSAAPGGVTHSRSSRPRPACWWSATTTLCRTGSAAASAFVEPASSYSRTCHCGPATPWSASWSRGARGGAAFTGTSVLQVSAQPTPGEGTDVPAADSGIDIHTTAGKLADLDRRLDEAVHAASAKAVEKQHAKGRRTARERIEMLFDEGSFVELDELARHRSTAFGLQKRRPYGDGVITGYGTVDGRQVCVFSQDFTIFGGSLGEVYGEKITKVMDLAIKTGCPIVGINEGAGARIQEGVVSLGLYGEIFRRNVHASGVIPQISLIMGSCAGGHVYSPAVTDFTVMVDGTSNMFITGPDVIKTVTGEDVTMEELGGARTHNTRSGNAHYMGADEEDALEYTKALLSYLPQNNLDEVPAYDEEAELEFTDLDRTLDTLIPDSPNQPYDMHEVIRAVLDDEEFLEVQELFAPNIVVGFGRVEGHSAGAVANPPMQFAGTLDIDASEKAARFVRFCDAFNIPVLTFVDVPGFLPGTDQEWNGIIRRGAKLIYAYAEATVPLVTVITRKAYGGAYDVMGSKHLGADINLAWPTAQIAVMGAQGAVNILYRKEIAAAEDVEVTRSELIEAYEDTLLNPYIAAERGYVDGVIPPHETRLEVVKALRLLGTKRETLPPKKHGNIPL